MPHARLLEKISRLQIDVRVKVWIREFLKGRSQRVRVGERYSMEIAVTSGVPQGSVLGPLLFLIYINDIHVGVDSKIRLFADDCIIYRKIKSSEDRSILQKDLDKISAWIVSNKMDVNTGKCKQITFTRRRNQDYRSYSLLGENISKVSDLKYLGVNFTSNLDWGLHIDQVVGKSFKTLHWVMRNIKESKKETKEMAYMTMVRPVLEYATSVWDPYGKNDSIKLEKVQRKAARYTLGKHRRGESVTAMLESLGWKHLKARRTINRLCGVYKAFANERGWKEIGRKLDSPCYIGRKDHKFKIKLKKQKLTC